MRKIFFAIPVLLMILSIGCQNNNARNELPRIAIAGIPCVLDGEKVIDAAIWMSYPWADEPRNHGVVMAYGDDKEAVGKAAEKLARHFWNVRKEFDFVKKAIEVGVGGEIGATAGAEVDDRFAPPIRLKGFVTAIKEDSTNSEVVVKIGYLVPELYELRGDWIMALTPGGVDHVILATTSMKWILMMTKSIMI